MKPVLWNQVNTLLDAVLELPAEQRDTYLQAQCRNHPELLQEVRSMLQAHEAADTFLETPAEEYAATLISGGNKMTTDSLVGQEVDGYRILDELGRGGMGIVYKVQNLGLKRTEALKIIAPLLVRDAQFLRRFQLEAQALARIHHPNIVTAYTLRQSTLGYYITMEYVEGQSLADHLAAQRVLSWQQARPLIKQLLLAFSYAHERGIIHRDIKPRNIMLTPDGTVKVMDFGLAKFYLQQDATQTQSLSGTLNYMSPEQIKGHKLDQRSDLFSLGVTIYELLSGHLPFKGGDSQFSIQRAIIEDEFPTLRSLNDAIPARLSAIVMKALEKEPSGRYLYAGEMLAEIEAFEEEALRTSLDDTLVEETPIFADRASKKSGRMWGRVAALILLTVIVAGGAFALAPSVFDLFGDAQTEEPSPLSTAISDNTPQETPVTSEQTEARDGTLREGDQAIQLPDPPDNNRGDPGADENTGRNAPTQSNQVSQNPATRQDVDARVPPKEDKPPAEERQPTQQEAADPASSATSSNTPDEVVQEEAEAAGQQPETTTDDASGDSNPASVRASVEQQAPMVTGQLKQAMVSDSWSGIPGPIAAFYQKKLKDLSRKFRVIGADVIIDRSNMQTVGLDVTLPITVFLTIQQKGRDGTQAIPIPSLWTWKTVNGRMTPVQVQDQ